MSISCLEPSLCLPNPLFRAENGGLPSPAGRAENGGLANPLFEPRMGVFQTRFSSRKPGFGKPGLLFQHWLWVYLRRTGIDWNSGLSGIFRKFFDACRSQGETPSLSTDKTHKSNRIIMCKNVAPYRTIISDQIRPPSNGKQELLLFHSPSTAQFEGCNDAAKQLQ